MGHAQAVSVGVMVVALLLLVDWNRPRVPAPEQEDSIGRNTTGWPARLGVAAPRAAEIELLVEHMRAGHRLRSELKRVTVGSGVRRSASVITYGYFDNRFRIAAWIGRVAQLAHRFAVDDELLARLDDASAGFGALPTGRLATAFDECLAAGAKIAEHASGGSRYVQALPTVPSEPTSTPYSRKRSPTRNWNVGHAPRRASKSR